MLEEMIKSVIDKQIADTYPHLQLPSLLRAKITKVTPSGEWFEYSLKIIGKTGEFDERYPEIPGVLSKLQVDSGKYVAIGLLYGELNPYIFGEVA
ncbi:hypothetical protein [Ruminiclostridium papyrosolvens]|uniref:Uncharacterized protein n=1 Tax=Ruminiclostridium papyrosolvens C7 TaxID=1330534 RepID=U4QXX1_9FIRM|nr:hypothetical protein [Ruminiclostridium papyrosolvens]EPR07757.1 hypothetical protein L323_19850 [Ruminiclostridium papyrosolvens C7]